MDLTAMQKKVFEFICDFSTEEGFPPSYKDIGRHFGYKSDGTVKTYLEALEKKGFIQRLGTARGIKILKGLIRRDIPILGRVAAGYPGMAVEELVGTLDDLEQLKYRSGRIALMIKGDSMKNVGIFEGDYVIIQTGVPVASGQIGAVMIDGDATLKRVYYEQDRIRLEPENESYQSIIVDASFETKIIGKYIALVRTS